MEGRFKPPVFNGPPSGVRPVTLRHPLVQVSTPDRSGFLAALPASRRPHSPPAVALGARSRAQPLLAPRLPGAQRGGGAGLQPPPRRHGEDPREFGSLSARSQAPASQTSAGSPHSGREAGELLAKQRAQRQVARAGQWPGQARSQLEPSTEPAGQRATGP